MHIKITVDSLNTLTAILGEVEEDAEWMYGYWDPDGKPKTTPCFQIQKGKFNNISDLYFGSLSEDLMQKVLAAAKKAGVPDKNIWVR